MIMVLTSDELTHKKVRTCGVKPVFQSVQGIWIENSRKLDFVKILFSLHTCAKCSVQPSNIGIRNAIMKVIRLHKVISNWFRGKTQKHLFPALLSFK